MMIQIERLNGPEAGRTTTHRPTERVTFGRGAGNVLRLSGEHLSRYHGELACEAGQWTLVCHSANAVSVGRRQVEPGAAVAVGGGETVRLGKEPLFAVQLVEGDAADEGAAGETYSAGYAATGGGPGTLGAPTPFEAGDGGEADEGEGGLSRRGKIWIGIGAYLFVIIGAFAVLSGLSGDRAASQSMPPQLPDERIAEEIRRPFVRVPSEREAARHATEARRWYVRSESSPEGLFLAHHHYKLARAYAGLERGESLEDGIDQLRFHELEQRLIDRVQREYREAFALAHNREWQAAERALRALLLSYTPPPDEPSAIVDNLDQQLRVVMRSKPEQRFR